MSEQHTPEQHAPDQLTSAARQAPIVGAENATIAEPSLGQSDSALSRVDVSDSRVIEMASGIDPYNSVSTISFGQPALQSITDFSDKVLSEVKTTDAGEAGTLLESMVQSMSGSQFGELGKQSLLERLPIIGEMFNTFNKFVDSFDSIKDKLDKLAKGLEGHQTKLAYDLQRLDGLYQENLSLLEQLDVYIAAGKLRLSRMQQDELPAFKATADKTGDALDAQHYRDALQASARLEKRVHNLEITRLTAIQAAPQIRLSQEGNKILMEDIQDIVHSTFPLWKRQFVIAVSNYEKEKALKVTKVIKDYTNQQYKENADKLKYLEEQLAENYQRGVLDVEALEHVNKVTIETLNNTLTRMKQGQEQRRQAELVLQKSEQELKDALREGMEQG
ncbi:toxic anion resistance protein [Aliagarivorans taiwanensis]|uniref:toxic anion resistance protein n=1 Tax=Aliagarivorans taiwanensis TaxID=561966 RepID=UPI0004150610|nr:toxic anion resistance protein [Aliagarivorans taiwanensis]